MFPSLLILCDCLAWSLRATDEAPRTWEYQQVLNCTKTTHHNSQLARGRSRTCRDIDRYRYLLWMGICRIIRDLANGHVVWMESVLQKLQAICCECFSSSTHLHRKYTSCIRLSKTFTDRNCVSLWRDIFARSRIMSLWVCIWLMTNWRVDDLIQDIQTDKSVAKHSLQRPAYAALAQLLLWEYIPFLDVVWFEIYFQNYSFSCICPS